MWLYLTPLASVLVCPNVSLLAYADPGSGMLIWQLATAAIFGILFYASSVARKLRQLTTGESKNKDAASPDPER